MSTTKTITKTTDQRVLQDITRIASQQVLEHDTIHYQYNYHVDLVYPNSFTLRSNDITREEWNMLLHHND